MFKLSAYIAKLEDRWGKKLGRLWEKHKGKWQLYLPLGLSGWYFYGMLINSIRLGTRATVYQTGEAVDSIFLLPLENMEQHRQITLSRSHFFVLRQGERLRFYKGGEAGK